MEAKDLRVTNLIYNDRIVNAVILIGFNSVELITPQGNNITARLDLVKPIPLTEEWLIKFGINKYSDKHYILEILNRGRLNFYTEKDKVSVEIGNKSGYSFGYPKIKYLHELQNLYFALTGQELLYKQLK
jgi:hypothetical protein